MTSGKNASVCRMFSSFHSTWGMGIFEYVENAIAQEASSDFIKSPSFSGSHSFFLKEKRIKKEL